MHYYQFNVGSYRRDTMHLSPLEHGVYRMLIDTYYMDESPLTGDKNKLMRTHCIRSADEKQALENVLNDFFFVGDDGLYHNQGCDEGLENIYKKSESARKSAEARWKKREKTRTSSERNANALHTVCEPDANDMLPITHNPIPINKDNGRSNDQPYPSDLVGRAFEHFWQVWKDAKKDIGKTDTSPKGKTKTDKWNKLFNTAYFKKHSEDEFKAEVTKICEFVVTAHNLEGFNRFHNMQCGKFFSEKQWRDE